ncbi:MAG: hypothetical protein LUE64_05130 [Candidatus Gastranaerophilales bacterium]|nr:hypothetical protein [Candidatus Gastranaerophilales bacterium]
MLSISPITNVNNTLNTSFGSGVQTNYGISTPSPKNNMVEGGLLTGFVGTVAPSLNRINSRAQSIEQNLSKSKLDFFA